MGNVSFAGTRRSSLEGSWNSHNLKFCQIAKKQLLLAAHNIFASQKDSFCGLKIKDKARSNPIHEEGITAKSTTTLNNIIMSGSKMITPAPATIVNQYSGQGNLSGRISLISNPTEFTLNFLPIKLLHCEINIIFLRDCFEIVLDFI